MPSPAAAGQQPRVEGAWLCEVWRRHERQCVHLRADHTILARLFVSHCGLCAPHLMLLPTSPLPLGLVHARAER